ncbi:MAG: adenosine deaminase [Geobacteraceae bacterium GWC2_58_44]|nr:MAG: adenosine deaminase [Geobacteraceae bacterium GWC2_58_44]HBG07008.1 adenosine deaminase [Geobacter sp.]
MNLDLIPREELHDILCRMPKAELHIHIEGSLEPEMIFEMATRNRIDLPYRTIEELRAAYDFTDLQSFLQIYYAGAGVLQKEEDFFDMARAYLTRAKAENVIHTEIFFDPQTHTARGIPFATVISGLDRAIRRGREELGMSASLILCFLRHLTEEDAFATLQEALPFRDKFIGVGLDSGELGNPPEKFATVFAKCRELGLRLVAHAGEEGSAEYITHSLDLLKAERIDHGVHCLDDPQLVGRLARQRIPLTVCPLSNVKLCAFPRLSAHNIGKLLAAGIAATINSDDPAYFGGYLNRNFTATFAALPELGAKEAYQLARNSFQGSFVAESIKEGWIRALDEFFSSYCR